MSTNNPLGVDQRIWEAAQRTAAELGPLSDEDFVDLSTGLFHDFPQFVRARRAAEAAERAAQDPAA